MITKVNFSRRHIGRTGRRLKKVVYDLRIVVMRITGKLRR